MAVLCPNERPIGKWGVEEYSDRMLGQTQMHLREIERRIVRPSLAVEHPVATLVVPQTLVLILALTR